MMDPTRRDQGSHFPSQTAPVPIMSDSSAVHHSSLNTFDSNSGDDKLMLSTLKPDLAFGMWDLDELCTIKTEDSSGGLDSMWNNASDFDLEKMETLKAEELEPTLAELSSPTNEISANYNASYLMMNPSSSNPVLTSVVSCAGENSNVSRRVRIVEMSHHSPAPIDPLSGYSQSVPTTSSFLQQRSTPPPPLSQLHGSTSNIFSAGSSKGLASAATGSSSGNGGGYFGGVPIPSLGERMFPSSFAASSAPTPTWNASFYDSSLASFRTIKSEVQPNNPSTSTPTRTSPYTKDSNVGSPVGGVSPSSGGSGLKASPPSTQFLQKARSSALSERLSCSAPTGGASMAELWRQRKAECQRSGRLRHGSTDTTLSQLSAIALSMDEGFASDSDDDDDNLSSGDEDEVAAAIAEAASDDESAGGSKTGKGTRARYFWQYNVQSKGPKGPRLSISPSSGSVDPHRLNEIKDPVFSGECKFEGVKHAGKARRGDGNDLTPNPTKLHNIGVELRKLSRIIHEISPSAELPFNARSKSRKEKNKLASRACRLKKKAQHEANKLKLYGLQQEHSKLLRASEFLRNSIREHLENPDSDTSAASQRIAQHMRDIEIDRIAGQTSEYVNHILKSVSNTAGRRGSSSDTRATMSSPDG